MKDSEYGARIAEASKTIFSYCMARTRNSEDAKDLAQDIICELLSLQGSLRDDAAFYGFMWSVAGNVYKAWCRKRAAIDECELPDTLPAEELPVDDDSDIYLLRRELALLSERYRRAVILYYLENRSCSEISGILSVSESMVKYLLFKSRKLLKEGMNMERKLGTLSYNPVTLVPMYMGTGPNRFWDFMQSKIRQNILFACFNDSLTAEGISLETGIPLPYLDYEIGEMVKKQILSKDGTHYRANIVVIPAACADEIRRAASAHQEKIADAVQAFVGKALPAYRKIGFYGSNFSENTLRWQLTLLTLRTAVFTGSWEKFEKQQTAWGDFAHIWCEEARTDETRVLNICTMDAKTGDELYFIDYLPSPNGDHHDFWGNDRKVNILCDIARGKSGGFGEYELEDIAEMVRQGYIRADSGYRVNAVVYESEQFRQVMAMIERFISETLTCMLDALDASAVRILREHTPRCLHDRIPAIAAQDRFTNAAQIPLLRTVESGFLHTDWHPLEMATVYIVKKN